jgi:hypothetical protein
MFSLSLSAGVTRTADSAGPRLADVDRDLQLSLWTLHIDKVAAGISRAFARHGIRSLLLKGPSIARWLYQDGTPRPYGDADLIVAPNDWQRAQRLLTDLGFEKDLGPLDHPGMGSLDSEAWVRGAQNVDLHCTLWGLAVDPQQAWQLLTRSTEMIGVAGVDVETLAPPARAFLLATHAAKHGDGWALVDLERGVEQLSGDCWREAAALAVEFGAVPAFVAGLRLVAHGPAVIRAVGVPDIPSPEARLRALRVPMALGLEQLAQTPGIRAKAVIVFEELFPRPAFMRWWTPLAQAGIPGLALAYIWRLLWVAGHLVPAFRAWRRARVAWRSTSHQR